MKILLTCDPEIPVPPVFYGGVERLVDGLAKGYGQEGHEVFLVANRDSTCTYSKKNFKWPASDSRGAINIIKNSWFLKRVVREVRPDAVHSFSRLLYGYPLFIKRSIPFVQTYGRKISAKSTSLALKVAGTKLRFTACAAHMLKDLPHKTAFTPVFNFTDVEYFVNDPSVTREHLMFLGRIEDIKGVKEAILAAIQTNNKIIVAGNIQPGHEAYFNREIKPYIADPLVEYVGPVNDDQKRYYLQRSKALLFPVKWEEPFGIVMAEALACGTPVIGFNRGSIPEIIKDGDNGFIVDSLDEMTKSIAKLCNLNAAKIRTDAVERFSLQNITKKYLEVLDNTIRH